MIAIQRTSSFYDMTEPINYTHSEFVPFHEPDMVFDAAINLDNIPTRHGISFRVVDLGENETAPDKLTEGTILSVGLQIATLRLAFNAAVVTCNATDGIFLAGDSLFGSGSMQLDLIPGDLDGTQMHFETKLKLNFLGRKALSQLLPRLPHVLQVFAEQYHSNVLGALNAS